MKILFKVKTKYSKQIYDNFLNFHQKKYGNKYRLYTLIVSLLLIFCMMINFTNSNFITGFVYLLLLIMYLLYKYISPIKKINKELKSKKIKEKTEYEFTFYDKYFVVSDNKNFQENSYLKIYRVFEDKSFFYIYINKSNALILDKNNFLVGNPKNFMKFIKKKILFKF